MCDEPRTHRGRTRHRGRSRHPARRHLHAVGDMPHGLGAEKAEVPIRRLRRLRETDSMRDAAPPHVEVNAQTHGVRGASTRHRIEPARCVQLSIKSLLGQDRSLPPKEDPSARPDSDGGRADVFLLARRRSAGRRRVEHHRDPGAVHLLGDWVAVRCAPVGNSMLPSHRPPRTACRRSRHAASPCLVQRRTDRACSDSVAGLLWRPTMVRFLWSPRLHEARWRSAPWTSRFTDDDKLSDASVA